MSRSKVLDKVNEIFIDIFDDESLIINDATSAKDIEDWDSLEHINIIGAVEREFGIKFDLSEVGSLKNVGQMVDAILTKHN